jgi:hypothetical protein
MYQYAYAVGGLYCLAIWVLVYRLTPGSRKVMLWGGILTTWMGPLFEFWHRRDYWRPEYFFPIRWGSWTFGLEDLLISFTFGGLAAGLFDLVLRRRGEEELASIKAAGAVRVLLVLLAYFMATSLFISLFQFNSLHAMVIAALGLALWFLSRRRQWIPAALITGLLSGVMLLISYWGFYFRFFPEVLHRWWLVSALSGLMVLGVPVEELIWASISSFFYGPAFRYFQDLGS